MSQNRGSRRIRGSHLRLASPSKRHAPAEPIEDRDGTRRPRARLKRLTTAILVVGFGAAVAAYFLASPRPENPLGYEPLETKRFIHDLEVYGGRANVLATEFREWFAGLWYGRNLAYTIAVLTVLLVLAVRFFAATAPPED